MDFEILKAQWEELEDWKKLLIVLLISGILAYLVYFFILSEKIKEKERLQNELKQKEAEFEVIKRNASPERKTQLLQELEKEKAETEELKQKLEEVRARFKPRDDIKRTINFVTRIAKKNGVVIENINVLSTEDIYLRYNPNTDRVEQVVLGQAANTNKQQSRINQIKNRLVPGKKNNQQQQQQEQNNFENLVHLKRFKYSVSVRGTTRGIVNMVRDIVRTRNFVNVDKISLVKEKQGGNLVKTTLQLVSYTEGEKTVIPIAGGSR